MTKDEVTQVIRGVDVVLVTPIILIAAANKNLPIGLRIALGITGVATGVYNGYNLYTNWK